MLRVAIWAGLLLYSIYLTGAAWAGEANGKVRAAGSWAARAPAASRIDRDDTVVIDGSGAVRMFSGAGAKTQRRGAKDQQLAFRRPTLGDPREEIACLALNIYFEARGEPVEGKLAVGHVVMNRVLSGRFPSTVCQVVQQGGEVRRHRCQFSWWCDGRSDKPRNKHEWQRSSEHALAIYWGQTEDPTDGALWYHADYVKPAWRRDFVRGPKIGRHIFYQQPGEKLQLASQFFGG